MTDGSHASLVARVQAVRDRQLSAEEVVAYLGTPISDDERERVLELVRWFCRRYPTPAERLAYVRRATRRWTAAANGTPRGTAVQRGGRTSGEEADYNSR